MQFLDKRVRFLYPSFLVYMGEILLQFWNLKKLFQFSPKLWLYAITMPHFQFCTNNQQQLVIFIHVMVSAGVCFDGKGRLHLIPTRTKWMLNFMLKPCCRNLFKIADLFCHLASSFNRTARLHTHTAKLAQDWTATNCSEFIGKDEWPPNSPDLNPVDYHVWGSMLERYKSFQPSRRISIDELKKVLQLIWEQLPLDSINKAILSLPKRLGLVWKRVVGWTLWTYAKINYLWDFGICNNSQCFLTMKITSCCWLFHACKIENMA